LAQVFLDRDYTGELTRKFKLNGTLMNVKQVGFIDVIVLVNVLFFFKDRF
jgi:hypothetical protein